jgi:hypothetical protein
MVVHTHHSLNAHHSHQHVTITCADKENSKQEKKVAGSACDKKRKRENIPTPLKAVPLKDITGYYLTQQNTAEKLSASWDTQKMKREPSYKRACLTHAEEPINYEDELTQDLLSFFAMKEKEHGERKIKQTNPRLPQEYVDRFRFICAEWLTEVAAEMPGIRQYLVHLATSFMDRFIAHHPEFPKTKLQLLAATCFVIAAKRDATLVDDKYEPSFKDMVYYCDNQFAVADFVLIESWVLNTLSWELSEITPFQFLDSFIDRLTIGDQSTRVVVSKCTLFVDLWLKEKTVLDKFLPSTIAAAALYSTCLIIGRGMTGEEIVAISGKTIDDIQECSDVFTRMHRDEAQSLSLSR